MTSGLAILKNVDPELKKFVESIPSVDAVAQRIECNASEAALLKQMLRLAREKEQVEAAAKEAEELATCAK